MTPERLAEIQLAADRWSSGQQLSPADIGALLSPSTVAGLVAEVRRLQDSIEGWENAGYSMVRPYGDSCEECGTQPNASSVALHVIVSGSLMPAPEDGAK